MFATRKESATQCNVPPRYFISPRELASIGYVSENQDLPGRLTVEEYLDYLRPFYPGWDRALETSMRRDMQLPATRKIRDLSHGMRMKMALVCALPFHPRLLIHALSARVELCLQYDADRHDRR